MDALRLIYVFIADPICTMNVAVYIFVSLVLCLGEGAQSFVGKAEGNGIKKIRILGINE